MAAVDSSGLKASKRSRLRERQRVGIRHALPGAMGAKHFSELRAWQLAAELSDRVTALCGTRPLQADLEFRKQLRDAAEAAPRLIAEGFGRWGHRDFARYLVMARSELMEVESNLLELTRRNSVPS